MIAPPVVVGAGPAGLAVAAELHRRGLACTVLERGESVGGAWQGRYDSLRLHTARGLSGLPGAPVPRRYGRWVARDDVVAYLRAYADRFEVRPEFGVDVRRIDRDRRLPGRSGRRPAAGRRPRSSSRPATAACPSCRSGRGGTPSAACSCTPRSTGSPRRTAGGTCSSWAPATRPPRSRSTSPARAARVDLSVRTPPNIVRRSTLGVPSQLFGIALKRAPERVMNPVSAALRRVSVPDLSAHGLPAPPRDGFTQFLRTRTVPILDHGFVTAVRAARIRVVADVAPDRGTGGAPARRGDPPAGRRDLCHRLPDRAGADGRPPGRCSTNGACRVCTAPPRCPACRACSSSA